ncbi:MAG: hypothetical protein MUE78_00400 [Ilumatobacteraceae bacterium]|jgi:hypothetical protein|nr:hypothetical protein [Ilumatobacteraceae bacterium]
MAITVGHEAVVRQGADVTTRATGVDPCDHRVVSVALDQRGIGDPRLPPLADALACGAGT